MRLEEAYSDKQFGLFRVALGLYLFVHFAMLRADAVEVFSDQGMLPDGHLNPTAGVFPNLLLVFDAPGQVRAFVGLLALFSLGIAAGIYRRVLGPIVWYGFACLFNRNIFISNPSLAFVGFLLLALALIPDGERYALRPLRKQERFVMPPVLYWGAFFLAAVGYTASGLHKLTAPSWRDGTALAHVLSIPLARDVPLREWLLGLDPSLLRLMTWGAVLAECAYLPLSLFRRTRLLAWASMVAMHLGIITMIAFADLTSAMLVLHLFLWDPRWLKQGLFARRAVAATPGSD